MRIAVFNKHRFKDGRADKIISSVRKVYNLEIENLQIIDIYKIEGDSIPSEKQCREIFADGVVQEVKIDSTSAMEDFRAGWDFLIEVSYKPGVTDPVAITATEAIKLFLTRKNTKLEDIRVKFFTQYLFKLKNIEGFTHSKERDIEEIGNRLLAYLHNPLIQDAVLVFRKRGIENPQQLLSHRKISDLSSMFSSLHIEIKSFDILKMNKKELENLSNNRLLALSAEEMLAIKKQYSNPEFINRRRERGLTEEITDVELEMLAQTWSEHCKHKIFNATILYQDENGTEEIDSLFNTYIKSTTESLKSKKKYLKSVFHDNSGVIQFDNEHLVCFKVETHNSPSALDPYGGAITGIVGVNRDILGTGKGAKPIFNTNVLCFAYPQTPEEDVPKGLLKPRQVRDGVHRGIIDGGNQSGIPVAAGAFLFDQSYMGKPLVYCGTGGILPSKIAGEETWIKHIDPGDLAVMVGGRIGKDGIHGATFSSLSLNEESPTSAVQIGDPITQKKMIDFLLEARDLGLYKGITDNGAGGLSSSLGEMAEESGGVRIHLSKCPLKYPGLQPWEILISESQERMSLSVSPQKIDEFLQLARKRDVEATVVGEFTDSGYVEILYNDKTVGLIDIDFLHNGLPKMELTAKWESPSPNTQTHNLPASEGIQSDYQEDSQEGKHNLTTILKELLREPNIASKEELVRQYDHEVQGTSLIKPFMGEYEDGPTDGGVLKPIFNSNRGLTVTHGIAPWYSEYDTYNMALCAVDEAMRAHVALGGDPDYAAALDNFCWPDPVASDTNPDGEYKLAQLVRACKGLKEACLEYELPLISGKDSMKNDTNIGGKKLSVKPTLLISLMGIVPDIHKSLTTDFKQPSDVIFIVGLTKNHLIGSFYHRILLQNALIKSSNNSHKKPVTEDILETKDLKKSKLPKPDLKLAKKIYKRLFRAIQNSTVNSVHDLSEGGLAVALSESAIGGNLGAEIDINTIPITNGAESARVKLFSETPSRFIVTTKTEKANDFERIFKGLPIARIGKVTKEKKLTITNRKSLLINITIEEMKQNWKREF